MAGDAVPGPGEPAVFCRPVVTASALPRRDGTVRADGWLPDFVRLGELERHPGDGVIEEIAAAALEQDRLKKRQRRRIMSYPLVIRLVIAMTLMPDASYCEALRRVAGLVGVLLICLIYGLARLVRAVLPSASAERLEWWMHYLKHRSELRHESWKRRDRRHMRRHLSRPGERTKV